MTFLKKRVLLGAIAVGVLTVKVVSVAELHQGSARATTVSAVTSTITIDPNVGETFAPAPPTAVPTMTAQQAWASYTQVDTSYTSSAIPSDVTVQEGLLTLPLGPTAANSSETYAAQNELVYGYSWHSCPHSTNPMVQTLPPNPCIQWIFLDANTGKEIDDTWQQ
jgi:hypothetical protein